MPKKKKIEEPNVTSVPRGMGKVHKVDQKVVEAEERSPKPKKKVDKQVKFTGRGSVFVNIGENSKGELIKVMVKFREETGYIYCAKDEKVANALKELGYSEVE